MSIKLLGKTEQDMVMGLSCMYMSESAMFEFRRDFNMAELKSLTIEIRFPFTEPIILITFYRPEGPVKVDNQIHSLISNMLFEDKEFIMMGDVNVSLLRKPIDNDAKHMKNIYDSNNLTQLITEQTRTTDNINPKSTGGRGCFPPPREVLADNV